MVDKMYKQVEELSNNSVEEEKKREVLSKIKIFFGPSRQFANVFKTALLFSVEQHKKAKITGDLLPLNFIMQKEPLFEQILANMVLG